jgi:hypothetical protein
MLAVIGSMIALGGFALGWTIVQRVDRWVAKRE